MSDPACVTNYDHLYSSDYYAHAPGVTSFDSKRMPQIIAQLAVSHGGNVVDLGGGNGALATALRDYGVETLTVDTAFRDDKNYLRYDLARYDNVDKSYLFKNINSQFGENYLVTCLDVAEHIDIEHVSEFVMNLHGLVTSECIISISTRPSSAANRFHATILPIETWKKIFSIAGFSIDSNKECEDTRSTHLFSGADSNLISVSHWQRTNPFRENDRSHQHYLHLVKMNKNELDPEIFRDRIRDILDIKYRFLKRYNTESLNFPVLNYVVNFIQDWSFVRSLMDVWPSSQLRVILRSDTISAHYLHILASFLDRTGIKYSISHTAQDGINALENWGDIENSITMTATEGICSITHLMGSLIMLHARQRGSRTLCIQHGMTITRTFQPAAATFGVWDTETEHEVNSNLKDSSSFQVRLTGSPKLLDALMAPASGALAHRFGSHTGAFERTILIGLNLHWSIHTYNPDETYQWLLRVCRKNPRVLFILRPHPDDATVYEQSELYSLSNLLIVDDLTLLAIDWPLSRLINAVDGVVTTYSTLIIDASAAEKPIALLPSNAGARDPEYFLSASSPMQAKNMPLAVLSELEWEAGSLPSSLLEAVQLRCGRDEEWFAASRSSLSEIVRVGLEPSPLGCENAYRAIGASLVAATRHLNLDCNPHADRTRVSAMLTKFLSEAVNPRRADTKCS